MSIGVTGDVLRRLIAKFSGDKEAAADPQKPLYDMLGLWGKYGITGDPMTDSDYAAKTDVLIKNWAQNKGLPLSLFLPGKSPITPGEAPAEAASIIDRGLSLITLLNSVGVAAEVASVGQVESVIWAITNVINTSGLPGVIGDLYRTPSDIGVKIPLERRMNWLYRPRIPDVRTLVSARARNVVDENFYNHFMAESGYENWIAEVMAYAETKFPDVPLVFDVARRGLWPDEWIVNWLRHAGVHPTAAPYLAKLRWQLPGYSDIISIYMREGYLEEKWVEIPEGFINYMGQLGYDSDWAKRIWGKHWVLPGVNLLYDMFHKTIIDYDTMVQMLRYHDFEPVWRQRLLDNAYNMIPRVDLRRAYRYGMLGAEGLQERYEWLGFKPSDARIMSGIAERFSLERYYTRLETVARAAFRKGKLSQEGFISVLREINTPERAISITLEAETLAREAAVLEPAEEARTLTASQVLSLYRERILTRDVALTRLTGLGYTAADSSLLLSLSEPRPEPMEINRDLISAASSLYREGLMDPKEFKGRLRKAGLSEREILSKLEAEELRYRLDYARDLITMLKEGYKKDVYTAEELESYLLDYGMQPERVQALSALEQLRKLPKPRSPS